MIGYLMSRYKMSLNAAYNFVKRKRPEVSPNSSFMRYLERYEEELKLTYYLKLIKLKNRSY